MQNNYIKYKKILKIGKIICFLEEKMEKKIETQIYLKE